MKQRMNHISGKRLVVLAIITTILSIGLSYVFFRVNFIPNPSSVQRAQIDGLFKILFGIASIIFSIVLVVFLDAVLFFRQRPGDTTDGPPLRGNGPLELAWTLIPLLIVMTLGAYGGVVLNRMTAPAPQKELVVDVMSFRFGWEFTYPEYGITTFELGMPVDQPVLLRLQSSDVIHGFWIPEMGPKLDAVPGMTTELRLTPTRTGDYMAVCSQLCGAGHTYMTARARVMSAADFQKWVEQQKKETKPARGSR